MTGPGYKRSAGESRTSLSKFPVPGRLDRISGNALAGSCHLKCGFRRSAVKRGIEDGGVRVTAKTTLKWLTVSVCAVSMTPTAGAGQNGIRAPARVSNWPGQVPLVNLYTEQLSRTRLGLYLDVEQSRRFDRDGALVTGVMRDSPAEEAGLEDGDVITVFEGQVLTVPLPDSDVERDLDLDQSLPAQRLLALARDLEPGETVEIRYLRDGASNTVSGEADEFEFPEVRTFGERQGYIWGGGPDGNRRSFGPDADFDLDIADRMGVVRDRLGIIGDRLADVQGMAPGVFTYGFGVTSVEGVEFIDLNPELGEYFGSDTGVLAVDVDEDSTLGLMAGDVVLAVGAREADTVGRVLRLIRSYDEDEPIQFRIIRRGSEVTAEGFLQ